MINTSVPLHTAQSLNSLAKARQLQHSTAKRSHRVGLLRPLAHMAAAPVSKDGSN
jgi:hypothetical protein